MVSTAPLHKVQQSHTCGFGGLGTLPAAVDVADPLVDGTDVTGIPPKLAPSPALAGIRPIPAGRPVRPPNAAPIPFPGLSVTPGLRLKAGPRPLPVLRPIPVPSPLPGLRPIPMGIPVGAPVVVWEVDDDDGCDWLLDDDALFLA